MKRTIITLAGFFFLLSASLPVLAKDIRSGTKAEETATIRTDGLACYFCAYGLERFFKKTGKIASFDMDMKQGLVTVSFIKDQPIVPAEQLCKYVYDAGFTPRWVAFSTSNDKTQCK